VQGSRTEAVSLLQPRRLNLNLFFQLPGIISVVKLVSCGLRLCNNWDEGLIPLQGNQMGQKLRNSGSWILIV